MDFLKSAVASAIAKGPAFPYNFGDRLTLDQSIWTLYNGTRKDDNLDCSIFAFDVVPGRSRLPLARNAATLAFINDEATSVHGNMRLRSVYTSRSGEWRLGGFEVLSSMKEDDAIIFSMGSFTPSSGLYNPPEVSKSGWEVIKRHPLSAPDSYGFGLFIFEVFNGGLASNDSIGQIKNIPSSMQQSYKRLLQQNPKARLSISHFREQDAASKDFPEEFFSAKVLPELLKSVEFGGGGAKVFTAVMKIGTRLSDDDYNARLTPVIVRLFSNPDRAIRVCLLDHLPDMIDHLTPKLVNDRIFPQMITGFTDVAPVVREQTIKAVLTIITKLSDRTVNGDLLKHLAKTSNDEQPGIRTNTTICLGKIARNLGANTRQKVLIAAFCRSLRDPFVHARNAALLAFGATADLYSEDDCAVKVLPALCPLLIDKEKHVAPQPLVRDQTSKTFDIFVQRVRKHVTNLPDTVLSSSTTAAVNGTVPRIGTPQHDTGWAGWAISSFTNKLATASGDMQVKPSKPPTGSTQSRSSSVPPATDDSKSNFPAASASQLHRQVFVKSPAPVLTRTSTDQFFNDAQQEDDEIDEAWGDMAEEPFFDAPVQQPPIDESKAPTSFSMVNGEEEPDFEGWLNAQAQARTKPPLPKGMSKPLERPTGGRKAVTRTTTTGHVGSGSGAKRLASTGITSGKVAVEKRIDIKLQDPAGDDDWGDAWD
ncbi:MAG: hypothetical protein Q9219_006676 [cf. Caloplaca sp. 3 TL-2023]